MDSAARIGRRAGHRQGQRRLARMCDAIVAIGLLAACAGDRAQLPSALSSVLPTTPSTASPEPTSKSDADKCAELIVRGEHFRLGRRLTDTEAAALRPVLHANHERATGTVFTTGSHDFVCFVYPDESSTVFQSDEVLIWDHSRLHDHISADRPVLGANGGGGFPGPSAYTWGALAPHVARLVVTVAEEESQDAHIENGYFTALFYGTSACCVFMFVAYDAAGVEIYRAR